MKFQNGLIAVEDSNFLKEELERLNEKNIILQHTLNDLHKEISDTSTAQISIDETNKDASEKSGALKEARDKIKALEGQIKGLENKIKSMQGQNSVRNNNSSNTQKQGKRG